MLIRPATLSDIPALHSLIAESVTTLQKDHYSAAQREGALGDVFGVDTQLILDGTYLVAEVEAQIIGCGGWSKRRTLFGSDHAPGKDDAWLDPLHDSARIRAFFIHPAWARRGIGTKILSACEEAAFGAGFKDLELVATLPGVPLYRANGYRPAEEFEIPLSNGESLPVVRMKKP
jgi:N-acetylglutamate synthase-like GNAT family acetyltransferase